MNELSKVPAKFESIIIIPSGVMNFQSRKLRKKSTLTHIHLTTLIMVISSVVVVTSKVVKQIIYWTTLDFSVNLYWFLIIFERISNIGNSVCIFSHFCSRYFIVFNYYIHCKSPTTTIIIRQRPAATSNNNQTRHELPSHTHRKICLNCN
jgi:hypothetical protein